MKIKACAYLIKQVILNEDARIFINTKPVVGVFDSEKGTLTDEKDGKVYSGINSGDDNTFFMVARVEDLAAKGAKPEDYFKDLKDSFYYATRKDDRFYYKEFNTKELDEELTSQMFDIIYVLSHPNEMYDGILNGYYDSNELTILDWDLASIESNIGQLRGAIKEVVEEDEDSYQYQYVPRYLS